MSLLSALPWRGMLACFEEVHIVAQNFRVIECQGRRRIARIEESTIFRIIGRYRGAARPSDVHGGDGLAAWVAIRPRINPQQCAQLDVERDFFLRLADGGLLDRLAKIDKAAGNRPSFGKIFALDQNDLIANFGDHIGGDGGTYWTRHLSSLPFMCRAVDYRASHQQSRCDYAGRTFIRFWRYSRRRSCPSRGRTRRYPGARSRVRN